MDLETAEKKYELLLELCRARSKKALVASFASVVKPVQEKELRKMQQLLLCVDRLRKEFRSLNEPDKANAMLSVGFALHSIINQLSMWIGLKEGRHEDAWNALINAQEATEAAASTHDICSDLVAQSKRLSALEHLLFPPQMFGSTGCIVRAAQCSICLGDYESCDHLAGVPYNGELCRRIITDADLLECSIVYHPANKRCRMLFLTNKNVRLDLLTREEQPAMHSDFPGEDHRFTLKDDISSGLYQSV